MGVESEVESGHRDLVEKRLEKMMIALVEKRHLHSRSPAEITRRSKSCETSTNDHDMAHTRKQ